MILKACKWVVSQERGASLQNVKALDNNDKIYLAFQKVSLYIRRYSEMGYIQKASPPSFFFVNHLDKMRSICGIFCSEVITLQVPLDSVQDIHKGQS